MTDPKVTAEERAAIIRLPFGSLQDQIDCREEIAEALTLAAQDRPDWWASRYEDGRKSGYAEGAEAMREKCAKRMEDHGCSDCVDAIRELPLTEDKEIR